MAAWDGSGSVFGLAMRVARLGADGAPLVGAANQLTTSAFTKIDITPVYEDGTKISETNAAGQVCLNYEADDSLTGYTVSIEICSVAPELMEILSSGAVLLDGVDVIGYQSPQIGSTGASANGVSVETWSRAVLDGGPALVDPFLHWVMPRLRKLRRTGVVTIGGEAVKGTFEGLAIGNPNWLDGPQNDWPIAVDSSAPYQFVRTSSVPTPVAGYASVLADV